MQLIKFLLVIVILLPLSLMAQDCATLIKLQSPYLQGRNLYLDEVLSQQVVNSQVCISSDEMQYLSPTYHLELFSDTGRSLESLPIFPEYAQVDVIYITTADLLSDFCHQCDDISKYKQFIDLPIVQEIANEMDDMLAQRPKSDMTDIIKEKFLVPLSALYEFAAESANATGTSNKTNQITSHSTYAEADALVTSSLPDTRLPLYSGAELTHFLPRGVNIETINSLPLAAYNINASSEAVLDFYQAYYPDHDIVPFGSFKVLIKEKLPVEGYGPEYMAIPHLVISEDPLSKGKTILQIIYQSPGVTAAKSTP